MLPVLAAFLFYLQAASPVWGGSDLAAVVGTGTLSHSESLELMGALNRRLELLGWKYRLDDSRIRNQVLVYHVSGVPDQDLAEDLFRMDGSLTLVPAGKPEATFVLNPEQGSVRGSFSREYGKDMLSLELAPELARSFADFTSAHTGEILNLVFCGEVFSSPRLMETIPDGKLELNGTGLSPRRRILLELVLTSGKLPFPVTVVRTVSRPAAPVGTDPVSRILRGFHLLFLAPVIRILEV